MQTNDEVRRKNGRLLVERLGSKAFCERVGISKAQLSQYIGRTPSSRIGEKMARQIETALGLERGWLDIDHSEEFSAMHALFEFIESQNLSEAQIERVRSLIAVALEMVRGHRQNDQSESSKPDEPPNPNSNNNPGPFRKRSAMR